MSRFRGRVDNISSSSSSSFHLTLKYAIMTANRSF